MTSLRFRIALTMMAVAVTAAVVVGLVTGQLARQQLYAEVDRSLDQASIVVIRGRVADPLRPFARPPRVDAIVLPERTGLESVLVQVVRADGAIVRSNADVILPVDNLDLALSRAGQGERLRTVEMDGERYRVRTVALAGGIMQAARSLAETERVLDELRTRALGWMALVSTVAALGGWLLAHGITARLGRVSRAAQRLATSGVTGPLDDVMDPAATTAVSATATRDEVTQLSRSFGHMVAALRAARDEQERLVQDAGHELRTPLTSLRTNVDVLARYPDLDDVTRAALLADLRRDVAELATLVNELVEVAAGDRSDETRGPLVLAGVVDEVVERFQRRTGRSVAVTSDDTVVVARRGGVERALNNVLDNAHKFDATGAVLEVRVCDGRVDVLDRGPGIDPDEQQRVFERFHRAVAARSLPGSGLGLAIVRDVVTRDGGTVHVAQRPGGGAVVGFELPVAGRATALPTLTGSSPHVEPAPTLVGDAGEAGGTTPVHKESD